MPCACGDVVASDVVLGSADPVTQGPCPADGLIVRAPQAAAGVTIDLHGQTLRGDGRGAGLLLLDGAARVVSTGGPATLSGFKDGVFAHGDTAVALVADLVVEARRRDGVRIEAPGGRDSQRGGGGRGPRRLRPLGQGLPGDRHAGRGEPPPRLRGVGQRGRGGACARGGQRRERAST